MDHAAFITFLTTNSGITPKTIPGRNDREKAEHLISRIKNWYHSGKLREDAFGTTAENPTLSQMVATWLDYRRGKFEKKVNIVSGDSAVTSQNNR
jgi:hypothetical protein